MIAILDYGSGNLRSAERALLTTGVEVIVTSDFDIALEAEGLVVPGVGAFGSCMAGLERLRGPELIRSRLQSDRPVLGICIGLQILFQGSDEDPGVEGVGIFPDLIKRLNAPIVPHMGWNQVIADPKSKLFEGIEAALFYFVHSFAAATISEQEAIVTTSEYGDRFIAAIEYGALTATQFHPEKSGEAGLRLLRNWVSSIEVKQSA